MTALLMGATSAAAEELAAQDKMFLDKAASDGLAEVELGQLAQQQAVSPEVKQFGQRMVQDHEQANQKLMAAAKELGATPPEKPSADAEATKRELEGMTGAKFDQEYMRAMIKDHDKAVALFQREAQEGQIRTASQTCCGNAADAPRAFADGPVDRHASRRQRLDLSQPVGGAALGAHG